MRNKYLRYIEANGPALFISEMLRRLAGACRGFGYRRMFTGKPGFIGSSCYVRGLRNICIGEHFSAGKNLWLEAVLNYGGNDFNPLIKIGNDVHLSNDVHISSINRIEIEDGVLIGSRVYIGDHNHGRYLFGVAEIRESDIPAAKRQLFSKGAIHIGKNVWIGDGVVIAGGISIESGAVIGANSVVTKDIPKNAIAAGSPARTIRYYD